MATWSPKVSIVIPVYNGSNYLAEAITSALGQDYQPLEVLVINDGSRDNGATEAVAKSFGTRIRYISKPNEGIAATLNRGIREMTGEYFSWLSHDDLYLPHKISRQIETLRTLENRASIIYGNYDLVDEHARIIGERIIPHESPARFYFSLFLRFPVHACTALFPKLAFEKVGGFDANWKFLQDTNMWFRLATFFPFVHVNEKFAQVRMHGEQGTVTRSKLGYAEGNLLYKEEMSKLSTTDIRRISGLSPFTFYLRCAESYRAKSYYQAAFAALRLAQKEPQRPWWSAGQISCYQFVYALLQRLQQAKQAWMSHGQ